MTYGENGRQIRAELTTLLRQHRIQQRLGGQGSYTVPESTTAERRAELGQLIQRYRHAAMTWCLQAVAAANPKVSLEGTTVRARGPAEELRYRLNYTINASRAGLPTMGELATSQEFAMVERWRQVARAAVLGEHDFPELIDYGRMSPAQCTTVLNDATEVTRALVVLDKRYEDIPGWMPIRQRGRLDQAARVCAVSIGHDESDYSVDLKGWQPRSATIDGGPLPGIGGVLQAEHNMLVHLARFPDALNLRRVIDGQRILSHQAARLASNLAPELADKWLKRAQTYKLLIAETRNVGGLVGNGGPAAAEAANAVGRLRDVNVDEITSPDPLRQLDKIFTRTDARVAAIIEQGVAERFYFVSIRVPRTIDSTGHLVRPTRERYIPINSPVQTDLLAITRHQLAPAPVARHPAPDAHESREELRQSIDHRPEQRAGRSR